MVGPNPLFNFYSSSDLHNADQVIANIDQGGLTLPDRDYYLKDDEKMTGIRQHFVEYMDGVFVLAAAKPGESVAASGMDAMSSKDAETVLRIETAIAKAQMDRTARRDPKNRDHKMSRADAVALAPNFHLDRYFQDVNAPSFSELNVGNPDYFKQMNAAAGNGVPGVVEDLRAMARAACGGAVAVATVRRCEFQVPAGADRAERNPGAVEALRELDGPPTR